MMSAATARLRAISQVRPQDLKVELDKEIRIARARRGGALLASYLGWTGYGNLGDEVLFEAHRALFPGLEVVPFRPPHPRAARRLLPALTPDYVLGFLGGGTLINQSPKWRANLESLLDRGMPVVCLGSGVAPAAFRPSFEPGTVADWAPTLRRLDFVGVRGPESQRLLAEVGVDSVVMGDPVFALAGELPPPGEESVVGLNIGVSARTIMHGSPERFLSVMVEAVERLLAAGRRVTLLPVCAEDVASNEELLRRVGSAGVSLVTAFDSTTDYVRELAACRVFVGQKLHATALATVTRVPSVMLAYQPKCTEFMDSLAQAEHCTTTDAVTAEWIVERVGHLEAHHADVRAELDARVTTYRDGQVAWAAELAGRLPGIRRVVEP